VLVVGGGGGGGGGENGSAISGGGGGGGGGVVHTTVSVTPGQNIGITVGAGGGGKTSQGGSGGNSAFGGIGAYGGGGGGNGTGYSGSAGLSGGSGGGGARSSSGGSGTSGQGRSGGSASTYAGGGGGGALGDGGNASGYNGAVGGSSATHSISGSNVAYGGGGGGGGTCDSGSGASGASGAGNGNACGNGESGVAGRGGGGGGGGSNTGAQRKGGNGGSGVVIVKYTALATCSVTFDQNPINTGSGTTLRWTSSNANQSVYINNVGYVGTSGSMSVAPGSTTDYSCYAQGSDGTDGWHSAILTVNPPSNCSFDGQTVAHGSSVTAYEDDMASPCVSQTRTCSNGSLSGSYQYASCVPATCTLDGVTVDDGESYTFFNTTSVPQGELCSSPPNALSRMCVNGSFTGSSSYQYASCSCVPSYSCSGDDIQYTSAACAVSTVQSCTSPAFCSAGSSTCLYPPPLFNEGDDGLTGHLQARPMLVAAGVTTSLFWDLSNVESCTVVGTNGDSWIGAASGASGASSSGILARTDFTLACTGVDGTAINETVTVNLVPIFQEL
jgi:hypothetical protein